MCAGHKYDCFSIWYMVIQEQNHEAEKENGTKLKIKSRHHKDENKCHRSLSFNINSDSFYEQNILLSQLAPPLHFSTSGHQHHCFFLTIMTACSVLR